MQAKPLIGFNADYRSAQGNQPSFSVLTAGYYDSILRAGGIPVIVPPMFEEDDVAAALEQLDGFVMVGGADLDPRRDGFMLHPSVRPMDTRRESFDRKLMQAIADRRLPVFGIGVGMQLLNVTMGGNLFLHIPEDVPTALPHRDPQDPGHRHSLEIVSNSLMERVYGDDGSHRLAAARQDDRSALLRPRNQFFDHKLFNLNYFVLLFHAVSSLPLRSTIARPGEERETP